MPDRVFCRRHDPDGHANWDSGFRPLLDDTCYMCATSELEQAHRDATEEVAKAHKRGWEQAKEESRRTIQQLEATNRALLDQLSKGITLRAAPVMMADAEAHRMGWEQAKREAYSLSQQHSLLSSTKSGEIEINELAIAIAALEYKEPAK